MERLGEVKKYSDVRKRVNELSRRINSLYNINIVEAEEAAESKFSYAEERVELLLTDKNLETNLKLTELQNQLDDNLSDVEELQDDVEELEDTVEELEEQIVDPTKGFSFSGDFNIENSGGSTATVNYQIFGTIADAGASNFTMDYTVRWMGESSVQSFFTGSISSKERGGVGNLFTVPVSINTIGDLSPDTGESSGTTGSAPFGSYVDFNVFGDVLGTTLKHSMYVDSAGTLWPA